MFRRKVALLVNTILAIKNFTAKWAAHFSVMCFNSSYF